MRLICRAAAILGLLLASACQSATSSAERPVSPAAASIAAPSPASSPLGAPSAVAASEAPASASAVASSAAPASAAAAVPTPEPMRDGLVNLTHLNYLSEMLKIDGQPNLVTHIYAEAPNYGWVDASGEGLACVDDVARAVIVYLDYDARTGEPRALERARAGLNFVLRLQADDGEFYNFIRDRAGTINTDGTTSYKSLGWWAYRGMWALARGYGAFRDSDAAYAATLREAYLKTEARLAASLSDVGELTTVHGFQLPAWLPNGAADSTGVAMLALAEYQAVEPNAETTRLLTTLGDGVRDFQLGGADQYPWGMHPHTFAAPGFWHAWGSHQAQALARAGEVLERQDYIDGAKRELDGFFAWQLAGERIQEMGALPFRQGQQAYGTNSIVQAAANTWRATGDERYARMAGLHASWFMGNNMARTAMYDIETGRGYDGIDRELAVNLNAGAESTIEALMALQAVAAIPEAAAYLNYRPVEQRGWQVIEAEDGAEVGGDPVYGRRGWTGEARFSGERFYELRGEDTVEVPFEVAADGEYVLYAAHMRRVSETRSLEAQAVRAAAPVVVDGDAGEWASAPALDAASAANILRGAESWRGAEVDSFRVRWLWDEHNLYTLAEVRDPEHEQTGRGPGVGSGDNLWLYLDGEGAGRRLAAKVTLASTPGGPEVWDWKAGFPLPNAQLAWQATEGGYVYEAALPWESLGVRGAEAGKNLGIEVGRGFGGASFMDLGGRDPDSAANLVPLKLVDQAGQTVAASGAATETQPARFALGVQLDGGETWTLPQAVSPDRDYLWLDRIAGPFTLPSGAHTLRLSYAGDDDDGSAIVDGFLLQPAVLEKTLESDGKRLRLRYVSNTGVLTFEE